jgi:hypothetical protein
MLLQERVSKIKVCMQSSLLKSCIDRKVAKSEVKFGSSGYPSYKSDVLFDSCCAA